MNHRHILLSIFERMLQVYGPRKWWPAKTRFEVIVGAILTQNVSWKNVQIAINKLQKNGLLNLESMLSAETGKVAENIRSSRYYNQKAWRLKGFCQHVKERYNGSLDALFNNDMEILREELLGLKGIGKETADSILLYAGQKPTFVSDAYTKRFLDRFGLMDGNAGYDQIRNYFMQNLPTDVYIYNEYHALIDHHCHRICKVQPDCSSCSMKIIGEKLNCQFPEQAKQGSPG